MATSTQLPIPPENLYAAFCGEINDGSVKRIVANLTGATFNNQNVHLLFQSSGGCVGDGVCLYNFFRSLPIELTIYNVGSVYSAGVLAYLGGKRRVTSKRAMFMVHRVMTNPGRTPAMAMKGIAKSLILEDERVESILRESITLPADEEWSNLDKYDFFFSGEEAVDIGLAHEIGEYSPPANARIWHFVDLPQPPKS